MSVLSDRDILTAIAAGEIAISPFNAVDVQPASVDLHLDGTFRVFRNNRYGFIDPRVEQPDLTEIERV
ncbi:MAG: dCTP deaminase, partial [bacterium]|nr:dCTP deaminase [Candidatus Aquidulcis sp.]